MGKLALEARLGYLMIRCSRKFLSVKDLACSCSQCTSIPPDHKFLRQKNESLSTFSYLAIRQDASRVILDDLEVDLEFTSTSRVNIEDPGLVLDTGEGAVMKYRPYRGFSTVLALK